VIPSSLLRRKVRLFNLAFSGLVGARFPDGLYVKNGHQNFLAIKIEVINRLTFQTGLSLSSFIMSSLENEFPEIQFMLY